MTWDGGAKTRRRRGGGLVASGNAPATVTGFLSLRGSNRAFQNVPRTVTPGEGGRERAAGEGPVRGGDARSRRRGRATSRGVP